MTVVSTDSTVRARVRELNGQQAVLEVEEGGCGRCHETGGCGGQKITQMFCSGPKTFLLPNTVNARVGDTVRVAVGEGVVRRTANRVYGIPLLAALSGAVIGNGVGGDAGAIAGALAGLAGAFLMLRFVPPKAAGNSDQQPHIVSRL